MQNEKNTKTQVNRRTTIGVNLQLEEKTQKWMQFQADKANDGKNSQMRQKQRMKNVRALEFKLGCLAHIRLRCCCGCCCTSDLNDVVVRKIILRERCVLLLVLTRGGRRWFLHDRAARGRVASPS